MKKILSIFILIFLVSLAPVHADDEGILPDILEDWLKFIFIDLGDYAEGGDEIFVIYAKVILFLLVFAVLFWSADKIFHEKARIGGTVAFIVALISVILLPGEVILMIFQTYSVIIGYLFILLPVIIALFLAYKFAGDKENMDKHPHLIKMVKGIIFIAVALFIFSLVGNLSSYGSDAYLEVAKWAKVGAIICLLIGLFFLLTFWEKPKASGAPPAAPPH